MRFVLNRRPHIQLDPAAYEKLRQQVLRRDDWRCQECGSRTNLAISSQAMDMLLSATDWW